VIRTTGFAPWRVVLAATVGLIAGNGPMMQFTFGVFLKPIGVALGLSRGTVSAALSIGLLGTALAVPFVGRAMDRFGIVRVIVPSVIAFAAMLALQGLLARNVVSLFVLSALMGIAAGGQTPVGYARAIVTWFDRQRGLALGIAMTGVGIGTILMPQLTAYLIASFGWRMAYVWLAPVLLVVALPAVVLFLRDGPLTGGGVSAVADKKAGTDAAAAARRTPIFVTLAAVFTLIAFAANGTIAHVVPLLTDRGVNPARAAGSLASIGFALIAGRLVAGWLVDRIDAVLITAAFFTSVLLGVLLLQFGSMSTVVVALVLIGLGLGAEIDLLAYLVARNFPTIAFGELYGTLFGLFLIGSSLGPLAVGASFDWTGSYNVGLTTMAVLIAVAIALTLTLRRSAVREVAA
jgi:MFS family permease